MTTESGLRIATGLVYLAIISALVHYGRLAGENGNIEEMKKKPLLSIVVAVIGFLDMFLIAGYIVLGRKLCSWASLSFPASLRWAGVIIGVCGLALFFWTHKVLGRNFSYTTRIQDEQELILDGPYRYVQHPMYTAFLLFAFCFFLITANWLIGICWFLGVFLLIFVRLRREEEGLRERFGEAYENYSQTTARVIPGVW